MTHNKQSTTNNRKIEVKKTTLKLLVVGRWSLVGERDAFTLLELLIVLAIMTVLAAVGVVSLSGYRGKQNLKKTTDEVVSAVVGTQKRSISQDAGKRWSVRFSNTTSSDQFIIFSSSSYSAGVVDRIYGLSRNVQFSEPSTGNVFDATFVPGTGALPSKKIISLVTGKGDGFVGDIVLNTLGRVTERIENGLVGYWHFDENTSSTAYDASGMGSNGTLVSSPTWQTGGTCISGSCLNFSNNYVAFSSAPPLSSAGTLSAWALVNAWGTNYDSIIFKGPGTSWSQIDYGLFRNAATNQFLGTINDGVNNMSGTGPKSSLITLGQWYHFVFTWNGSVSKFYTNGIETGSFAWTKSAGTRSTNMKIGKAVDGVVYPFNGLIDEVRIYNRALSATEVLNMYNDLK